MTTINGRRILVVEDSDRLRAFIVENLERTGYECVQAASVKDAFAALRSKSMDLVLLDLNLPDSSGTDVLRTIRRQDDQLPVIIVSSVTEQRVKIEEFGWGCDDYITKPFYVDELLVRVERSLKRVSKSRRGAVPLREVIESGPFTLDVTAQTVSKDGEQIPVRKKLFDLLLFFARNPDVVLSPELLHERAWDPLERVNENSLYVHISQLRSAIEEDPAHPKFLKTVRNVGYLYSPGLASSI